MEELKKGAGQQKPTPSHEQRHYSRLESLCLGLNLLGVAFTLLAYLKGNERVMFLSIGVMFTAIVFQCALNPIKGDDEDD